ncbi:MAG: hypothetical protein AAF212_13405, partial [Verrucomicrobiota bacterium]
MKRPSMLRSSEELDGEKSPRVETNLESFADLPRQCRGTKSIYAHKINVAWILVFTFLGSLSDAHSQEPLDPDETRSVLANYYRAHGGNTRIENLISLRFSGTISYPGKAPMTFRLHKKRPDLIRYELDLDSNQTWFLTANGDRFRQQIRKSRISQGVTPITDPKQTNYLQTESVFDGYLWELRDRNRVVNIIPVTKANAIESFRCEVSHFDPATERQGTLLATIWLNANSYLIEKREVYL